MENAGCIAVAGLPHAPLDAAAHFHAEYLPGIRAMMADGDVVILLPSADHSHTVWRRAAIQELAREAAPNRVNAIEGDQAAQFAETLRFLQSAEGITGQVLAIAGANG